MSLSLPWFIALQGKFILEWGQNHREAILYGIAYLGDGHEDRKVKKRWAKKRNMNIFTLVKGTICNPGIIIAGHKIHLMFWGVDCRKDN